MIASTGHCEQCSSVISAGSGSYSNTGKFLCDSCYRTDQIDEAAARGAAASRKIRAALVLTVAIIVTASGAMILAGQGELLSKALTVLSLACFVSLWFVPWKAGPVYRRGGLYLLLLSVVLFVSGLFVLVMSGQRP